MKGYDKTKKVQRSDHVSYFHHMEAYFVYHELIGYILQMSLDVLEFLEFFTEHRTLDDVLERFSTEMTEDQVLEYLDVFIGHSCLVEPHEDEKTELLNMVPVTASNIVFTSAGPDELTFYTTDRQGRGTTHPQVEWAVRLWQAFDGNTSLKRIASKLRDEVEGFPDNDAVLDLVSCWTHHSMQLLKFAHLPLSAFQQQPHLVPPYLKSTMPYEPFSFTDHREPPPAEPSSTRETMRAYHREQIVDAAEQFDLVETTLSHLFRKPHVAFGGKTYAGRMAEVLQQRELLGADTREVWELGGGTGSFCHGFLSELKNSHPDLFEPIGWKILELSPALQAAQQEANAEFGDKVEFLAGDIESYELPPESIDLCICNETIGDLTTVEIERDKIDEAEGEVAHFLKRCGYSFVDAPDTFHFNLGALKLVDRLWSALKPGGAAIIVEFGQQMQYPVLAFHLDHPEYSIHFGHLTGLARELGFEPEFHFVIDLLDMNRELWTLSTTKGYFRTLRYALGQFGIELEKIAYTKEMLVELLADKLPIQQLHQLKFHPIEERCMGLAPHEFKALLLKKPA